MESSKEHLYDLFINIINVFTVTLDQIHCILAEKKEPTIFFPKWIDR